MHYFVSYYDYYQPEAYIPQHDIYIEKDASINQEIDRLHAWTPPAALVSRRDVVVMPACRRSTAWARRKTTGR